MKIVLGNEHDPAFRYEYLARYAFDNCGKYGDPWGYSAQDKYNSLFCKEVNLEGQRVLSTIIIKLIIDNPNLVEGLKDLENRVWSAKNQSDYIKIIDECIEMLETNIG